jgi:V/A-type H+-transporting ATPase subunit D
MAIRFQYNKTYLQQLNRGLKVRENALPTLAAKEAALRMEVKRAKEEVVRIEEQVQREMTEQSATLRLWNELPGGLVNVASAEIAVRKIAGVKTPLLQHVRFAVAPYSVFGAPAWIPSGIEAIKRMTTLEIQLELAKHKVAELEFARKKTTQKVNLYEKVQIPEYKAAISKIKRFLEDEENLSKSSQKILKGKLAQAETEA